MGSRLSLGPSLSLLALTLHPLALPHLLPLWTLKLQHQMQRQPARGDSAISSHNGRPDPEANPIAYLHGEPLSNGPAAQNHGVLTEWIPHPQLSSESWFLERIVVFPVPLPVMDLGGGMTLS